LRDTLGGRAAIYDAAMGEAPPAVRLLGDVLLSVEGVDHEVGGRHPRALLAVVALDAGKVLATERIGDLVWGAEHLPRDERGALHQTATRVRRALRAAGLGDALRARPPGYVLDLPTSAVDALVFRDLVRCGRDASRQGDRESAAQSFGCALSLWQGPALGGVGPLPVSDLGRLLDDERWAAEELRCQVLLDLGRLEQAIEHLTNATSVEPLRESMWTMLVRAQAQAGRPAEAAACASAAISTLTAGLGIAPGGELSDLAARLRTEVPPAFVTLGRHRLPVTDGRRPLLDTALERAIAAAEDSARDATARDAHQEAVRQWERALELCQVAAPGDTARHLGLLLELGAAHNEASLDEAARRTFWRAAALARELDDPRALSLAALGYCADRITFRPPPETSALLDEALTALDNVDEPALRSRLLSRLAIEAYWDGPLDRCHDLAAEALVVAEHSGDDEAMLEAMNASGYSSWTPGRTSELVTTATAYLRAASAAGSRAHEHLAHRWLTFSKTELGDVTAGRAHMEESLRLADELGHPPFQWMARCIAAGHAICAGDLVDAERLAADALTIGSTVEPDVALDDVSLLIWTCRWLQGRLDEIADLVVAVAGSPGIDVPRRLGLAMTYASLGRLDDARAALDEITLDELDAMPRDASWFSGMMALAESVAVIPHPYATWAAEQLEPFRMHIGFSPATVIGPIAHPLGVCLWAAGRCEEGLAALEDAVQIADHAGLPIFATRSKLALAERRAASGDLLDARVLAEQVLDHSDALGLEGLTRGARRILHRTTT
jgi:DNA-binding SARP family transcriptional activator